MAKKYTIKPFSGRFLSDFVLTPGILPFTSEEIFGIDKELAEYEQVFMNPDVEKHLISKNELLASFAISKAEHSSLTFEEAQEVYALVLAKEDFDFIKKKFASKKKLNAKDYEKLEFFNIARTFRALNQEKFSIKSLTDDFIKKIHFQLTQGMDVFQGHLHGFTAYKSGKWRDSDLIRVGDYAPPEYKNIPKAVQELVLWLKKNFFVVNIGIFHTALYALHPFHNGNKRVCRILEHILLRGAGINKKNLYSTSYYYHKQKERYYKYLLYSLERKNLNHFTSFILEALALSMISVIKTSIESKRSDFLKSFSFSEKENDILKPLIKRREFQFKTLLKLSRKKAARQTLVTCLKNAVEKRVIFRREDGRAVYYGLSVAVPEQEAAKKWIALAKERLSYIPDDILLF